MTNRRRSNRRNRLGKIPSIHLPVSFEAGKGFVTMIIHIDNSTIGIKFEKPEQMLEIFTQLMENATIAWPENEFIKYYLSQD